MAALRMALVALVLSAVLSALISVTLAREALNTERVMGVETETHTVDGEERKIMVLKGLR
jgi:hypothetical protein